MKHHMLAIKFIVLALALYGFLTGSALAEGGDARDLQMCLAHANFMEMAGRQLTEEGEMYSSEVINAAINSIDDNFILNVYIKNVWTIDKNIVEDENPGEKLIGSYRDLFVVEDAMQ